MKTTVHLQVNVYDLYLFWEQGRQHFKRNYVNRKSV
jgi:hypothetical protein